MLRKLFKKLMNVITMNDERYEVKGRNIVITDVDGSSKVTVNGVEIKSGLSGTVEIKWEGDLASLSCNTATINGDVHGSVDANTVSIKGSVTGDIDSNTVNVSGDVNGNIDANNMNCRNHTGKIKL